MRIFVDGIVFQNGFQRGIQRYFREVLTRVSATDEVTLWLQYPAQAELPGGCRVIGPDFRRPPGRRSIARVHNRLSRWRRAAECARHDVFHSTYYTPPPASGPAQVVTVHDMICERFQYLGQWPEAEAARKRQAIESARSIIAISRTTADELISFYPHVADRVRVVHHGADHLVPDCRRPVPGPAEQPDKGAYVLFVGDRLGYKNFHLLLEAATLPEWPGAVHICVAGRPFTELEALLLRKLRLEGRVRHLGTPSDADLSDCYRGAAAFVFPSLCEGFGFPLLEAQASQTPVVCSDISVFQEVGGESVECFDPRDPRSLVAAILRATERRRARELREGGLENVRRFTWASCAAGTGSVYGEAAGRAQGKRIANVAAVGATAAMASSSS